MSIEGRDEALELADDIRQRRRETSKERARTRKHSRPTSPHTYFAYLRDEMREEALKPDWLDIET